MQEQFDKYTAEYAKFAGEGRTADAMMWSVSAMQLESVDEVEGFAGEKKKRREVMDAVEILAKKKESSVRGNTSAKEGGAEKTMKPGEGANRGGGNSIGRKSSKEGVAASAGPQYRYTTALENPKIAKGMLDRALDTKIELSQH